MSTHRGVGGEESGKQMWAMGHSSVQRPKRVNEVAGGGQANYKIPQKGTQMCRNMLKDAVPRMPTFPAP